MAEQMIDALEIRCINADEKIDPPAKRLKTNEGAVAKAGGGDGDGDGGGCGWVGAISEVSKHEAECDMAKKECLNDGCDLMMCARELEAHYEVCLERHMRCLICQAVMHNRLFDEHASSLCPEREVSCPNNGCGVIVTYSALAGHRLICPQELLTCGFGDGKCDAYYQRSVGRAAHDQEAMQAHLLIAMAVIDEQVREMKKMKSKIDDISSFNLSLSGTAGVNGAAAVSTFKSLSARWFLGKVLCAEVKEDENVMLIKEKGWSTTYAEVRVFFKRKQVATSTDVDLGYGVPHKTPHVFGRFRRRRRRTSRAMTASAFASRNRQWHSGRTTN
jgi:hypothetical protein